MYAEDGIKQESNVRYTLNFNLIAKGGFNSTVFDDEMQGVCGLFSTILLYSLFRPCGDGLIRPSVTISIHPMGDVRGE